MDSMRSVYLLILTVFGLAIHSCRLATADGFERYVERHEQRWSQHFPKGELYIPTDSALTVSLAFCYRQLGKARKFDHATLDSAQLRRHLQLKSAIGGKITELKSYASDPTRYALTSFFAEANENQNLSPSGKQALLSAQLASIPAFYAAGKSALRHVEKDKIPEAIRAQEEFYFFLKREWAAGEAEKVRAMLAVRDFSSYLASLARE